MDIVEQGAPIERLRLHIQSLEECGADNTPRLDFDDKCGLLDLITLYRSLLEETEPVLRAYGEGRLVGNPGVFLADRIREAVEKR